MRQVEGSDAQGPKAAEHGEDAEPQVVPRGHHEEVVLALGVTRVVALQQRGEICEEPFPAPPHLRSTVQRRGWVLLLAAAHPLGNVPGAIVAASKLTPESSGSTRTACSGQGISHRKQEDKNHLQLPLIGGDTF